MPELPPWLNVSPGDFASAGRAGMSAGLEAARTQQAGNIAAEQHQIERQRLAQNAAAEQGQIAAEHARLSQQEKLGMMHLQASKEQAERNFTLQQQRENITAAYHQSSLGLQKQKLQDAQQISARKYAAQAKLAQLTQAGVPFDKAVLQVDPVIWSPGVQDQMMRTATATAKPMKMTDIDAQDRRLAISRFQKAQAELHSSDPSQDKNLWISERKSARAEMDRIAEKYSGQTSTGTSGSHPTVTTQEQFDALKPGDIYVDKSGKRHQKPQSQSQQQDKIPLESYGNTEGFIGSGNYDVPAEE